MSQQKIPISRLVKPVKRTNTNAPTNETNVSIASDISNISTITSVDEPSKNISTSTSLGSISMARFYKLYSINK
jgi:hypothetical protein